MTFYTYDHMRESILPLVYFALPISIQSDPLVTTFCQLCSLYFQDQSISLDRYPGERLTDQYCSEPLGISDDDIPNRTSSVIEATTTIDARLR